MREMAWQAVGHGADAVLYWEWRAARNGQEQYYGTLLGADGTPVPEFDEVKRTGAELAAAAPLLAGTSPSAQTAMIFSYDSRWAIDLQRHHKDFDPIKQFVSWYRPLRIQAQAVDIVSPDANFDRYPLVVAPSLNVLTEGQAARLADYVRQGGHLVLGPRSGMKDDANALWPQRQPGPLSGVLGARVEQFYALDEDVPAAGALGDATASIWAETLAPEASDVEVLERYGKADGWLDGKAAAVTRRVGKGRITYVGAWLDPATMSRFAGRLLTDAGIKPIIPGIPETVEVAERSGAGRRALIVINHGAETQPLALPSGARLVVGDMKDGRLPPHGVAVVALPGQTGASRR
jgi:beta-galactosidase